MKRRFYAILAALAIAALPGVGRTAESAYEINAVLPITGTGAFLGKGSLEAIAAIRAESPDTQIVVLTMQEEPAYARQALSAGACGYVLKEAADSELVEAVRRAAAGEIYLDPALGARIAREPLPAPPDDLSEREVEVLRLIALGHTNSEIAHQLFLSVRTVETHRSHIQQKLRVSSRAELVRYALQRGLISDE